MKPFKGKWPRDNRERLIKKLIYSARESVWEREEVRKGMRENKEKLYIQINRDSIAI